MHCVKFAIALSFLVGGLARAQVPFRLLMEDGSSIPLTNSFPNIDVLSNRDHLKIIAVRNTDPFPLVLVYYDENHPLGISAPSLLTKIFPQEQFQLSQPVNTDPNRYHIDGPEMYAGMQVKYQFRELDQGGVSFILIAPYEDIARVNSDFLNIAKAYNPPTRLPFEKQIFEPKLLWWGSLLFAANLGFLWLIFSRFETFSKAEEWE